MKLEDKIKINSSFINTIMTKKFLIKSLIVFIMMFIFFRIGIDIIVSSADNKLDTKEVNNSKQIVL